MQFEQLGPYRIDRVVGRGGMGAVYAAVHSETEIAPVAASTVKLFNPVPPVTAAFKEHPFPGAGDFLTVDAPPTPGG